MKTRICLSALALLASSSLPALAGEGGGLVVIADSFEDFSTNQGQNGWFYGFYDGDVPAAYEPPDFEFMNVYDSESQFWKVTSEAQPETSISALSMLPSVAGPAETGFAEQWAVRRWISGVEAPVLIDIDLRRPAGDDGEATGDGVRLHVFIDGVRQLLVTVLPENNATISLQLTDAVVEGSVIDFAIDPIGSSVGDATDMRAIIRIVPAPSALAVLGLGGLAAARRRR